MGVLATTLVGLNLKSIEKKIDEATMEHGGNPAFQNIGEVRYDRWLANFNKLNPMEQNDYMAFEAPKNDLVNAFEDKATFEDAMNQLRDYSNPKSDLSTQDRKMIAELEQIDAKQQAYNKAHPVILSKNFLFHENKERSPDTISEHDRKMMAELEQIDARQQAYNKAHPVILPINILFSDNKKQSLENIQKIRDKSDIEQVSNKKTI